MLLNNGQTETPKKNIKPKFRVVAIDETEHWSDDIKAQGKVWGVYLVDMNRYTYCCELTPSLELHFLYYVAIPKKRTKDRKVADDFQDLVDENYPHSDTSYVGTNQKFSRIRKVDLTESDKKTLADEGYEVLHKDVVEYLRANHYI